MNRKVVINNCYGGFGLSLKATILLYQKKNPGKTAYPYSRNYGDGHVVYTRIPEEDLDKETNFWIFSKDLGDCFCSDYTKEQEIYDYIIDFYDIERHDPDLVSIVEELGEEASGRFANLKVIDIGEEPYHISEYDGYESVITQLPDDYWK